MYQPKPGSSYTPPVVKLYDTPLTLVVKFSYLGSTLSENIVVDDDISMPLSRAGAAFGNLTRRLWNEHGIATAIKVKVYKAVVITTLLYGCETWTLYRRHIKQLDQFHMRCLSKIGNIKWQDMIPNTEVLKKCNMPGIEVLLLQAQLRWCGHLVQLKEGSRTAGGQKLRFKDTLKSNLKSCNFDISNWESYASDRSLWRSYCKKFLDHFEDQRLKTLQQKRQERKTISKSGNFTCDVCGCSCTAHIGLWRHKQSYK